MSRQRTKTARSNPLEFVDALRRRLPPPLQNKYIAVTAIFVLWMCFIDRNNFIAQFRLSGTVRELTAKRSFYTKQAAETRKEYDKLFNNPHNLEEYAREHYWMHREGEEVFVLEKTK